MWAICGAVLGLVLLTGAQAQSGSTLRPLSATPKDLYQNGGDPIGQLALMQQLGYPQSFFGDYPYQPTVFAVDPSQDPSVTSPIPQNPAVNGSFRVLGSSGVIAIHAIPAANGEILFFGRPNDKYGGGDGTETTPGTADPKLIVDDGAFTEIATTFNLANASYEAAHIQDAPFCAGHTVLPDGRGLIVGGEHVNLWYPYLTFGGVAIRTWDPMTGITETIGNLERIRWYPTVMVMGDGNVLFLGGAQQEVGDFGATMGPTSSGPVLVTCSPNAGGSDNADPYFDNPSYSIWNPTNNTNSPALALTILMDGWPVNTYPYAFLTPSGSVVIAAGAVLGAMYLTPDGAIQDDAIGSLPSLPVPVNFPYYSSATLMPLQGPNYETRILFAGGTTQFCANTKTPASTESILIDVTPGANHGLLTEDAGLPRFLADLTILPDGRIFLDGGAGVGLAGGGSPNLSNSDEPTTQAAIYDITKPVGQRWTLVADAQIPRMYHSIAFLTANAEVLIAGGETTAELRVQLYTPDYLQNGKPRPVITKAPQAVTWNQTFSTSFSNVSTIDSVAFVRMVGATHGIHFDQRMVVLTCEGSGSNGAISCTSPPQQNIAPPGIYFMFLLSDGVPSVASYVTINADAQPAPSTMAASLA